MEVKEALCYTKLSGKRVRCHLCAHECVIADGKMGICRVRENQGGTLRTLVYGRTIVNDVDPIEKKPLLHFYPGSSAYSVATPGCNFQCRWCQNWHISQVPPNMDFAEGPKSSPEQIVANAQHAGCRSIAYTYTEPTVFFEYAYDTARLAQAAGLANVHVTNGYMTDSMLTMLQPSLSAANVDLKAFREETYRRYVGARLQPVLDSLKRMKAFGIWLEITTLVIPGVNDDPAELRDAAGFIFHELGADTPWHISRFFPAYRMTDVPPTPTESLRRAREIGLESGLHYVYSGNEPGEVNTFCHACGRILIRRSGLTVIENRVRPDGNCPDCSTPVVGVGMGSPPKAPLKGHKNVGD